MNPIQKVILASGLIVLICSCSNSEQEIKETKPVDSVATTKTIPTSQRTQTEAKTIIDELHKRLVNGEDFATLATTYSEDPGTKMNGGKYESVRKDIYVPEFEKVVFDLKLNEISAPFITEYGYHIATVIAIREDERDVRHILIMYKK